MTFGYQKYMRDQVSKSTDNIDGLKRITKIKDNNIYIYEKDKWKYFDIRGIRLSSFAPNYSRNKGNIDKKQAMRWLNQIDSLNANTIILSDIMSPAVYSAIYDYNLNKEKPIYVIQEIEVDESKVLEHYNAFNLDIKNTLKEDVKNAIDIINGNGFIFGGDRYPSGIYLKDISKYTLGYVVGLGTNPEMVALTNIKNENMSTFSGEYYSINDKSKPFEHFIAEIMDFSVSYEIEKYNKLSLISYITSIETDPLKHKNQTELLENANIDITNIVENKYSNIFVSYSAYPNSNSYISYNYESKESFLRYLKDIKNYYNKPLIITDIGIPSSRGMSRIDVNEGFNRGNFSESEAGEQLVKLLSYVNDANIQGVCINSWQDNWNRSTEFNLIEDYILESNSTYWFDSQSSDESFGLLKFEANNKKHIDGNIDEWKDTDYLINQKNLKIKVDSDPSYLYLMIEKDDWTLTRDEMYIGLDINPSMGSNLWKDKSVEFKNHVDFIVELDGYNDSRILVNERYNLFNYLYKYYSYLVDKQTYIPNKNSDIFSPVYIMNRKQFYLKDDNKVLEPLYYETGKLLYGNNNPDYNESNSLSDFNNNDNTLELRIPWTLINVINPLEKNIRGDFYKNGIEDTIKIENIQISAFSRNDTEKIITDSKEYAIPRFRKVKYNEELKESYYILKEYWKNKR